MAHIPPFLNCSIPDVLTYFRQPLSHDACAALVEKDAYMRTENDALRAEIQGHKSRFATLNRSFDEEIKLRELRDVEIGKLNEENLNLRQSIQNLVEEASRMKTAAEAKAAEEVSNLKKDGETKRVLEENRRLVGTVEALRRKVGEKEEEIRKARVEKVSAITAIAETKKRAVGIVGKNDALRKEKGEMEAALRDSKNENISAMKKCNRLEEENGKLAERNCVLQKEAEAVEAELEEGLRKEVSEKEGLEAELRKVKIEKNGVVKRSNETKKRNRELSERIGVLEKANKAMEAELIELRKTVCDEGGRDAVLQKVKTDKIVAVKRIKRGEEDMKNKHGELVKRIGVLEQEKKMKSEMIANLENDIHKRTSELVEKIRDLERGKGLMEENLRNERMENERILNQMAASEAFEDRDEADLRVIEELRKENSETMAENRRMLNEKAAVEAVKNRVEAELKKVKGDKSLVEEENSKLMEMIQASGEEASKWETEKTSLNWRMQNMKRVFEEARRKLEQERDEKISEQEKRTVILEREKAELVAAVEKARKDKSDATDRIVKVEKTLEAQAKRGEELEDLDSKNAEVIEGLMKIEEALVAKIKKVNTEKEKEVERISNMKKALEEEQKKTISVHVKRSEVLETQMAELKAEICRILKADMEKSKEIESILNEKITLEEEKKKTILEHVKWTEILEREKAELKAKVCKVMIDKKKESERIIELNKDLEAQKKLVKDADEHASGILETIILVEREKEELQAEVLKLNKEKSKRTESSERLERIQKILNGNLAIEAEKEEYEKKNLELGDRIIILEKEKRELEADIRKKNEAIMALEEKNRPLEDLKKDLAMEISRLTKALRLKECLHLANNDSTLSTSPLQNEGQNTAVVPQSNGVNIHINHGAENTDGNHIGEMTSKNACKRKRTARKNEGLVRKMPKPACESLSVALRSPDEPVLPQQGAIVPCEMNRQMMISTTHSNGSSVSGDVLVAFRWEADQDLLDAFDVDDELCLKAVCALYRKHKRLSDSAKASPSSGSKVFREPESTRKAITIGEYVTIEDPECKKTKKMVGKLNKLDNLALGTCRTLVKEHYKQVFEIYSNKEDPLYLS